MIPPMKATGHPQFYDDVTVTCTCGNTFVTGSTKKSIQVELCYKCHPLYTGEQRFVDVKGRVDKFKKKQEAAKEYQAKNASRKNKKGIKSGQDSKSLRELLGNA